MATLLVHQNECDDLFNLLKRTIDHGENNSALVIGPRGSGKTCIINYALERLKQLMKEKKCDSDLIIIQLSGLLSFFFFI